MFAYPHAAQTFYTRAAGSFSALQRDFYTYAVVGTGTTSSLLTAFLDETHNNPALEALASMIRSRSKLGRSRRRTDHQGNGRLCPTDRPFLPDTFGDPDIAPSADGSIGLEWVPTTAR